MIVGAKQIRKAIEKGGVAVVFLARNADPGITGPIATKCNDCGIDLYWVPSMEALGKKCGIDVGAAAAAAVR